VIIDDPDKNDNRLYDYSDCIEQDRAEYNIICDLVSDRSKVVDFGCGNGSLLKMLQLKKNITGIGYEISLSGVAACQDKGINAVCESIDKFHPELKDREFDYAICNVTIQMVMYPELLLKEMVRVSRYQIISFPNFAYISNRLDLLIYGRMPQPMLYDYNWYSTGHIHQLSIVDFEKMIEATNGIKIVKRVGVPSRKFVLKNLISPLVPNLLEKIPIFLLDSSQSLSVN
jgi:methionine biosynthesis protein MetW